MFEKNGILFPEIFIVRIWSSAQDYAVPCLLLNPVVFLMLIWQTQHFWHELIQARWTTLQRLLGGIWATFLNSGGGTSTPEIDVPSPTAGSKVLDLSKKHHTSKRCMFTDFQASTLGIHRVRHLRTSLLLLTPPRFKRSTANIRFSVTKCMKMLVEYIFKDL